jgi:hypothetical protein
LAIPRTILRELANSDLQDTLAGVWSLPVILISPDGVKQIYNKLRPDDELSGQVLMARKGFDPTTGGEVVVKKPVVTLPVDSLDRVPSDDDVGDWVCQAPTKPQWTAPKKTYRVGRPIEGGDSHSMIRLYLEEIVQVETL